MSANHFDTVSRPLDSLHKLVNKADLLAIDSFEADAGIPYVGDANSRDSYALVGLEYRLLEGVPKIRCSLGVNKWGEQVLAFSLNRFYVPNGEKRTPLESVGMPRFRNDEDDIILSKAPERITSMGVIVDFDHQTVGIAATSPEGDAYGAEFSVWECNFPDHNPSSDADVAYKMGHAAIITAVNKYCAVPASPTI